MRNVFQVNPDNYSERHKKRTVWYKTLSVLCCIMVFFTTYAMVLPAITLEGGQTEDSGKDSLLSAEKPEGENDIELKKQIKFETDEEGNVTGYTLRIESYVTGTTQIVSKVRPVDIVLVLDASGSMSNSDMDQYTEVYTLSNNSSYFYQPSEGNFTRVYHCSTCKGWYTASHDGACGGHEKQGTQVFPKASADAETGVVFYSRNTVSNMTALKESANDFIGNISTVSPDSRIAIVKFAETGTNEKYVVKDPDVTGNEPYYTQTVAKLTQLSQTNVTSLKSAVNRISTKDDADTSSDWGMYLAQKILENAKKAAGYDRDQVVIMFTDGEPNHGGNGLDTTVANDTIANAKKIKDSGALVYTIGCFSEANGTPYATTSTSWSSLSKVNKYMHFTSSNFASASSMSSYGTATYPSDGGSYYKSVTDAGALAGAFKAISYEIGQAAIELDAESELKDYIAEQYNLDLSENKGVSVHTETFKGKADDGSFLWEDDNNGPRPAWAVITAKDGVDHPQSSGLVTVSGFDYSAYYVDINAAAGTHVGKKLVVEIPIQPQEGVTDTGMVKTNAPGSGIYIGDVMQGEEFPQPDVEVAAEIQVTLDKKYAADIDNNIISFKATGAIDAQAYAAAGKDYSDHIYLSDATEAAFSLGGLKKTETLYAIDHIAKEEEPVDMLISIDNIPKDYVLYAQLGTGEPTQVSVDEGKASYTLVPTGQMQLTFFLEYKPEVKLTVLNETLGTTATDLTFDYTVSYENKYEEDTVKKQVSKDFTLDINKGTPDLQEAIAELQSIPLGTTVTLTETTHNGFTVLFRNSTNDTTLQAGDSYTFVMNDDMTLIVQNTAGTRLPSTGGSGTEVYIWCGSLLMAIAVAGCLILVLRRRKQQ